MAQRAPSRARSLLRIAANAIFAAEPWLSFFSHYGEGWRLGAWSQIEGEPRQCLVGYTTALPALAERLAGSRAERVVALEQSISDGAFARPFRPVM
jgi:hypothetical protein